MAKAQQGGEAENVSQVSQESSQGKVQGEWVTHSRGRESPPIEEKTN